MKRLQLRFVLLTTLCLLVILAALVTVLNILSYHSMVRSADWILSILAENGGQFPEQSETVVDQNPSGEGGWSADETDPEPTKNTPMRFFSAELPHESRFFSVLMDDAQTIVEIDTSHIAAISDDKAISFAGNVVEQGKNQGFYGVYRYVITHKTGGMRIIFLDTSNTMVYFFRMLYNSVCLALILLLVVVIIISFLSHRILKPIAENYEMQRQFISDAGHELKTPLTVIRADADVLELELGHNEWLEDIQRQTNRLSSLTNNLLLLSRMEDARNALTPIDFPLSDCVSETAAAFDTLAKARNREILCEVEPMLTLRGDERSISHLISILLDNAIKYSPEGGTVRLRLEKVARTIQLRVYNTTEDTIPREVLPRLFDRFYRIDSARNSCVGGHGIGLALAKAIVSAHGGKIQASIPEEKSIVFVVTLPQ